jgi:diacylglycerol kinase family enzyme
MRTHAFLVINPSSGDDSPSGDELAEAAHSRGIETHLLRKGEDPGDVARVAGAEILGMAGGDGSLAAVAAAALDADAAFVCVPFGTRNHFARDVGLDRDDPVGALAAFTGGVERRVDTGRVNDRLFLNNVSLGVYAHLVHRRERHRRRRNALARLRALGAVVRHRHGMGMTIDGEPVHARVVLVSNNAYELSVLSLGERERLDEGLLHVYAPRGLLRSGWRERSCEQVTIDTRAHRVRAAVDGEPEVLQTPLELRIEPLTLRVLLPRRPG